MNEVRPLRAYAEVVLGRQRSPQHDTGLHMVPYLRAANVTDGALNLDDVKEMNFTPREQEVFALRPGDVLVTEGSGSLRAVGASAVWNGDIPGTVCFQNTLLRLRPRETTDPRFLAWWCRYAFADGLFASAATGANIFHLSADRLRSLPMSYLPLNQQQLIAGYLDAESARIGALIARKRLLIATVLERFESSVLAAVTGQGDASLQIRPSGLEWAAEVPVDWGTPTVSANFSTQLGKMLSAEAADGPEQYPYLRNVNVQWDRFELDDLATMHFGADDRRRCRMVPGDLMVCEGGEVGRAAVWMGEIEDCFYQKAIHRVRPRSGSVIDSRFLMYCLRAAAKQSVFAVEGNQSTIAHLTGEQLRVHRFPWPPADERADIVAELDRLAERTRAISDKLREQIELLQEHRQAMITAAVTGQMEIPSAA